MARASITLVSKYVGEQFLDNTSNSDRKLDAYVTQDVRLNILLTGCKGVRSIDFNLTARNVLSELYESNGWAYSYFSEGRRQALVGLFPQAPVNVLGGVCVNF